MLEIKSYSDLQKLERSPIDDNSYLEAVKIVEKVRDGGLSALLSEAERLGDINQGQNIELSVDELKESRDLISKKELELLERTAGRIRDFANGQRQCLQNFEMTIPGGTAGHVFKPVRSAGCYAPGGNFSLPSSVLMTTIAAKTAGVERIIVASPKPTPITKAAAFIGGADLFLTIGGAQAIAAMAYGVDGFRECDVIVGPGNKWVTAAKKYVSGFVGIDMLAGPSELVVLGDDTSEAHIVAADLLAQAEHDIEAIPILVTTSKNLINEVNRCLKSQLNLLSSNTAKIAIENGFAVLVETIESAIDACNLLAPEHLEVHTAEAERVSKKLNSFGSLFIGTGAAEVFGDYGVGPNHVLPTGSSARFSAGLSILTFLKMSTWIATKTRLSDQIISDSIEFARLEGLEAHARAAELRSQMYSEEKIS